MKCKLFNAIIFSITTIWGSHGSALAQPVFDTDLGEPLFPEVSVEGDLFGSSIAIDNDTNYQGSALANSSGLALSRGVYVVGAGGFGSTAGAFHVYDIDTNTLIKTISNPAGMTTSTFGHHVDIDNGILVASIEHPGFSQPGTVLVYNLLTDSEIAQLAPSPEAGYVPAFIDNGVIAIGVAADSSQSSTNARHGAVYLYDVSAGSYLPTVYPPNEFFSESTLFGQSVRISDGLLAVSRRFNYIADNDATEAGEIYVYDINTGSMIFNYQPDTHSYDGHESVFILEFNNGLLAVERKTHHEGGWFVNDVIKFFDVLTGLEVHEFDRVPYPGAYGFGDAIDINDNLLVISAIDEDNGHGLDNGTLYVYNASTFDLIYSIVKPFGGNGYFGTAVATKGGLILAGKTSRNSRPGTSSVQIGAVYICNDADGDGLQNHWEIDGIPYIRTTGDYSNYVLNEADPFRKDIYVEIDQMAGATALSSASIDSVIAAFANAPVENLSGVDGIALHIHLDHDNFPNISRWALGSSQCGIPTDFFSLKYTYFGTVDEFQSPDVDEIIAAKRKAYRYGVNAMGNALTSGIAQIGGDNFILFSHEIAEISSTGIFDTNHAACLMHELGHNLGLLHGGDDHSNWKPNRMGVMNYALAYQTTWTARFFELDYAGPQALLLRNLPENSLLEAVGVGQPWGRYKYYTMPFGIDYDIGGGVYERRAARMPLNGSPIDYAATSGGNYQDGEILPVPLLVSQDLNYLAEPGTYKNGNDFNIFPDNPSPGEVFYVYDDWSNLDYRLNVGSDVHNFVGGCAMPGPDYFLAMENIIGPLCNPDLNQDGTLNFFDISEFISNLGDQHYIADWNRDGAWNFFDTSAFLEEFNAGCP